LSYTSDSWRLMICGDAMQLLSQTHVHACSLCAAAALRGAAAQQTDCAVSAASLPCRPIGSALEPHSAV